MRLFVVVRIADRASGRVAAFGFEEASSLGWAVGVDSVSVAVDDHMVVVPTEGGEVVGVVGAASRFWGDVVGLEPVAGLASVGGAGSSITVEDEPFN